MSEVSGTELDQKISYLKSKVDEGMFQYADTFDFDERWEKLGELISEIHECFKAVRYPSKDERSESWSRFAELREQAYAAKRKEFEKMSTTHFWRLDHLLVNATYSELNELFLAIISAGIIKETAEDLKAKGKLLHEAIQAYNEAKHQMTKEHRDGTREKITQARESLDLGWEKIKQHREEQTTARLQKNRETRERTQNAIEKKKSNIEKNKENIEKASGVLERVKASLEDLKDKISESYNDNWKEKAEGWKDEKEDKIRDIESSIDRMEGWIEEDEKAIREMEEFVEKLDTWIEQDDKR